MTPIELLTLVSRWAHVGTAIVLVGGTVFMRFVLMPAAAVLSQTEHEALRQRLIDRWKLFVHVGVALLLASGFYNYLGVTRFLHRGDTRTLYSALIGIKILLAFGLFFVAIALTSGSAWAAGIRGNRRTWLGVAVGLAAAVVAISGYLKLLPPSAAAG